MSTINSYSDPFSETTNSRRLARTLTLLRHEGVEQPALDLGGESPLLDQIRQELSIEIGSTDFDLDSCSLSGQYKTIFLFEVIEHLGSPLRILQEIHSALDTDGILYLSMPLVVSRFRPTGWLRDEHHIFEMDRRQFDFLIKKAGFEIEQEDVARMQPLWRYFTGFRIFIRLFTDKNLLVKLRKQETT
jgi:SAM-dependent methyltransferase